MIQPYDLTHAIATRKCETFDFKRIEESKVL